MEIMLYSNREQRTRILVAQEPYPLKGTKLKVIVESTLEKENLSS